MSNRRYAAKVAPHLGRLCVHGHDHEGSGKSLRYKRGDCVECVKVRREAEASDPVRLAKRRESQRERDARNREQRTEQSRIYKQKNKDEIERRRRERYYANHKENLEKTRKYQAENAEKIRAKNRKWREAYRAKNPDATRAYAREYYARNRLRIRIRNRVSKAFRLKKIDKVLTVEGYGIDIPAIARHLGPCPGLHGEWHIDHIRPLASFDLSDPEQVRLAFAPENHQWLTADENLRKRAKYG